MSTYVYVIKRFFFGGGGGGGRREKVRGSPLFRNEFINSIRSAIADSIYHLTLSY